MLAPPPVQSSGEPTSSTLSDEAERGGLVMAEIPPVQCWEQLSKYEGFKVQHVEAGMAASLSMIIAHTQQVFIHRSGRNLPLQASGGRYWEEGGGGGGGGGVKWQGSHSAAKCVCGGGGGGGGGSARVHLQEWQGSLTAGKWRQILGRGGVAGISHCSQVCVCVWGEGGGGGGQEIWQVGLSVW